MPDPLYSPNPRAEDRRQTPTGPALNVQANTQAVLAFNWYEDLGV